MTPIEIKEALQTLGLKHQALAAPMLGYGHASRVSDMVNGKKPVPPAVARLVQAYLDGWRPADWLGSA
jgi:plasmid maintenance system antidote protein VapI